MNLQSRVDEQSVHEGKTKNLQIGGIFELFVLFCHCYALNTPEMCSKEDLAEY